MSAGWVRTALVVEDHALMRALISDALTHAGFDVHARSSASEAIADFDVIDPDVLITDIDLGERPNGIELATIVHARAPYTAVVFLTNYPRTAASTGISGLADRASFVNKSAIDSVSDLVRAVEETLAERPVTVATDQSSAEARITGLSRTQLDTLRRIALGWSNVEIARQRGTSIRALERTVTRTYEALGLANDAAVTPRVAAANLYVRVFGLPVDDDDQADGAVRDLNSA
jgi:DNA-binding NarL/FixJ family response regulator